MDCFCSSDWSSAPPRARGIFWDTSRPKSTFFATYFYHANAGAFINLTLPLVAGQAILAFRNEQDQLRRAFWGFLLLMSITSVFVNTSRASMAIGILIMAALAVGGALVAIKRHRKMFVRPRVLATGGVVFACAVVLILSFGVEGSLKRWNESLDSLFASEGQPWEGRISIYRTCWLSLPSAGWLGFGPGTFSIMFPHLEREHGTESQGILRYAHQDYLQTLLEWGALGAVLWALLIGGGIVRAILYLRSYPRSLTREHGMWIALCALSLIGVLIHSLVDFPLRLPVPAAHRRDPSWSALGEVPPEKTGPGTDHLFQPETLASREADRNSPTRFPSEDASSRSPWHSLDQGLLDIVEHCHQREDERPIP